MMGAAAPYLLRGANSVAQVGPRHKIANGAEGEVIAGRHASRVGTPWPHITP